MEKEYLELQSVLRDGAIVSNVRNENNRVYFEVDGHEFQTFSSHVYHKDNPVYNHVVSDIWARSHNTPEGIEETEKNDAESQKKIDLYRKWKNDIYKIVFTRAVQIFIERGADAMARYIDYYFDIMENDDNCQKLIELFENKNKTNE